MQLWKYSSISNQLLLFICWSICNYYIAACPYIVEDNTEDGTIYVCPNKTMTWRRTKDTLEEALKWSKGRSYTNIYICIASHYNTGNVSTIENVTIVAAFTKCCDNVPHTTAAKINISSETTIIKKSHFCNITLVVHDDLIISESAFKETNLPHGDQITFTDITGVNLSTPYTTNLKNADIIVNSTTFDGYDTHMSLNNVCHAKITGSHFLNAKKGSLSIKNSETNIASSHFIDNKNNRIEGLGGGAIFMDNKDGSNVTVLNCTFTNNSADRAGGTFYLRRGYLNLNNVTITGPKSNSVIGDIIYCVFIENNTAITMENVNITISKNIISNNHVIYCINIKDNRDKKPNVIIKESLNLTCPRYHNVTLSNQQMMASTIIVSCDVCKTEYKYNRSSVQWDEAKQNFSLKGGPHCNSCPTGANCSNGNIICRDNYWGYDIGTDYKFILCPTYYCCSKYNKNKCSDIDTCAENRMGKICGKCNNQSTLNLFDERCIPKVNAVVIRMNRRLLLKCFILGGFSYVMILIYLKEIIGFIKYILLGNIKSKLRRLRNLRNLGRFPSAVNMINNDVDVDDDGFFNDISNEDIEVRDGNDRIPTQIPEGSGNSYTNTKNSTYENSPLITVLTQESMIANESRKISKVDSIYSLVDQAEDEKSHASGVVKILLFFYQVASIIRIPASAKSNVVRNSSLLKRNFLLTEAITAFFNIRFDFPTSAFPFQISNDLEPQLKELFKLSTLISIFAIIFIFAAINKLYNIITSNNINLPTNSVYDRQEAERNRRESLEKSKGHYEFNSFLRDRENSSYRSRSVTHGKAEREYPSVSFLHEALIKDSNESTQGDDSFDDSTIIQGREIDCYIKTFKHTPFTVRLMGGLLQALIISFSTISLSTLTLVNCVNIKDKTTRKIYKVLYINGEENCYSQFQIFLWTFNVVWVFPFPIVLYLSCNMLRRCEIRPWLFLTIIFVPPLYLVCFFRQQVGNLPRVAMSTYDVKTSKYLLTILDEPFKEHAKPDSRRRINWEPVLITRRLFLVISVVFIQLPILKLFPSGLLIWAYLVHHSYKQPYKNKGLNDIEMFSLSLLLILVLINMYWAFTIQFMINTDIGLFLLILEMVILTLPFTALFLCFLYKLIKKYSCCKSTKKYS